jgi:hypothetical protein
MYFCSVDKQNIKLKDLHNFILLCCMFFGILFFFNHNYSKPWKQTKAEECHAQLMSFGIQVNPEDHEVKCHRPLILLSALPEFNRSNLQRDNERNQKTISAKNFLQVKIPLKNNRYNLYFASGFHEPPALV